MAQREAASRSDITIASGAFRITSWKMRCTSDIFDRSPSRAYSSGATARKPCLASRRQTSLMYSWTPKISSITSTTGNGPSPNGRAA